MSKVLLLAAPALFACILPFGVNAQTIDLEASRTHITAVDAKWRFHLGDNPSWSQPGFNDSQWPILEPRTDLGKQGFPAAAGLGWFRFHLQAAAHTQSLVLQLPRMAKNYQLFCNGQLIGQVGKLPPEEAQSVTGTARVFTLPVQSGNSPAQVTVALRTWQDPSLAGLRANLLGGRAYVGEPQSLLRQFETAKSAVLLSYGSTYTADLIAAIVAAATLLLLWLTRERFYLWFACYLALNGATLLIFFSAQHFAWTLLFTTYSYLVADLFSNVALSLFVLGLLNIGTRRRTLTLIALLVLAELGPVLVVQAKLPTKWADSSYFLFGFAMAFLLAWYLIRGWRAGNLYAKLLFFPFVVNFMLGEISNLGHVLVDFNVPYADSLLTQRIFVLRDPFLVSATDVGQMIALLAFLAVLIYRFARTSREQQRLSAALNAAHDIQNRLVPVVIPTMGGLHTEIAYRAAEEVGGDFCQILPRPDGSIFVAIGDVSGKGLQAAMLGAVAVGALRSIGDEEIAPAAALERLNNVLLRTESSGFVTCLCLVLTPEGEIMMANAGHLSPYLDGAELPLEAGLPLGIVPGITYTNCVSTFPSGARLTLLSDGVVEARSHTGELFGFERTSQVSLLTASQIAEKAHHFGQEDDITVITLDWCVAEVAGVPA